MGEHEITLADCYYAVARDLEQQAERWVNVAKMLNGIADEICEQSIAAIPPSPSPPNIPELVEDSPQRPLK